MPISIVAPDRPSAVDTKAVAALEGAIPRIAASDATVRIRIGARALEHEDAAFEAAARGGRDWYAARQTATKAGIDVSLAGEGLGGLYAVYAWLEHQGWSFHVHGDVVAEGPLHLESVNIGRKPQFTWRGLQIWNYWWCGRDSWGFDDYVAYLNQFPKLGLNQFEFPLYWYEPLYTGARIFGAPMQRLPLSGASIDMVRIGAEHFRDRDRWTSPDIPFEASDEERTAAAQSLMRRVFSYARSLGLRTVVGIEPGNVWQVDPPGLKRAPESDRYEGGLLVQPSSPSGDHILRARLSALFEAFPDEDVYALWQSEMGPARATTGSPHPDDCSFREAFGSQFDLTPGDLDQIQWLRHGARIANELRPGVKLATGGWGAERILGAADALLPPDMIRATIADYEPRFGLRRGALDAYSRTKGERLHTTWAEVDQHLWMPQAKITATREVLAALRAHGVEGASMLHWRTGLPDPDLFAFTRLCWVDEPADQIRATWAHRKFGDEAAPAAAAGLAAFEAFNEAIVARTPDILHSAWWVGFDCYMSGLLSANRYLDGGSLSDAYFRENVTPLIDSAAEADGHLQRACEAFDAAAHAPLTQAQARRLAFWRNRAYFGRDLYRAHVALAQRVQDAARATTHDDLRDVLAGLNAIDAEGIVARYAQTLSEDDRPNRGETGLLLSLNVKFLGSVKRIRAAVRRLIGGTEPGSSEARLDVRCGAALPRNVYGSFFELLRLSPAPWSADVDMIDTDTAFSVQVRGQAARLTPEIGIWTAPDVLEVDLRGPPGAKIEIAIYLHEEPDWHSAFRRQDVTIGDTRLGPYHDFMGRGPDCADGVWVCTLAEVSDSGSIPIRIRRLGGADARMSRLIVRDAGASA